MKLMRRKKRMYKVLTSHMVTTWRGNLGWGLFGDPRNFRALFTRMSLSMS